MNDLPLIYPITDKWISGLSHAEQFYKLCEGGATIIQLREKRLAPREFFREAEDALKIAREFGARLIINDRADIALALGAEGLHVGQHDIAPTDARRILGEKAIIGLSTHSIPQLLLAVNEPVDYIAFGPIFDTSSKDNAGRSLGLQALTQARSQIESKPLVAIGGVTIDTAAACIQAGANSVAMISALLADPANISSRVHALLQTLEHSG